MLGKGRKGLLGKGGESWVRRRGMLGKGRKGLLGKEEECWVSGEERNVG